jgi:hypothetical protein
VSPEDIEVINLEVGCRDQNICSSVSVRGEAMFDKARAIVYTQVSHELAIELTDEQLFALVLPKLQLKLWTLWKEHNEPRTIHNH